LDISYAEGEGFLKIDLERLSRDEIEHFMQRLIIFHNEESQLEESLIDQNHLHQITKFIPLGAQRGDRIKAELHFGKDQVF